VLAHGEPLRGLSVAEIEARVTRHPWIRNVRVALLPTGTVVVEVEERTAGALLSTTGPRGSTTLQLVDAACSPFLSLTPAEALPFGELPRIAARAGAPPGADTAALCAALSLAESIRAGTGRSSALPGLAAFEIVLPEPGSDEGWVLRKPTSHEVLLGRGTEDELDERLSRLGRLFAANPEQLDRASTIDLRFAEQAVLRSIRASR